LISNVIYDKIEIVKRKEIMNYVKFNY